MSTSYPGPAEAAATPVARFTEEALGDFSDDPAGPTPLEALAPGDTEIVAAQEGSPRDIDYVSFSVPEGTELSRLTLAGYDAGAGNLAFLGLQAGPVVTVDPFAPSAGDLLGGITYGAGQLGQDILPAIGALGGAIGFTGALPAGTYTLWLNQTGPASEVTFILETTPLDAAPDALIQPEALSDGETLEGGPGSDTLDLSAVAGLEAGAAVDLDLGAAAQATELTGTGGLELLGDGFAAVLLTDIENLVGTAFADVFEGSAAANRLDGGAGNDSFLGTAGDDTLDGGEGTDRAVYDGPRAQFVPDLAEDGTVTLAPPGGRDTLTDIERIDLADGSFLYDLALGSAEVDLGYRLYAAAFARTPDEAGLRFWVARFQEGVPLEAIAEAFTGSPEFALLFGEDPTDAAYITALYRNVLEREPDQPGFEFWLNAFSTGLRDREEMLIEFADTPENIARTREVLEDGVFVLPAEPGAEDALVF